MSLLGQDSITITDITDVNPIRLDLTSSQPIYQTKKTGENYAEKHFRCSCGTS